MNFDYLLEILKTFPSGGAFLFWICISLCLFSGLVYYLLYAWRVVPRDLSSFLSFLFLVFSFFFSLLGFRLGLQGYFYVNDIPSWSFLRYSLQLFLLLGFILLYFLWDSFSLWLRNNSLNLAWAPWLDSFILLKDTSVLLLEKIVDPDSKAFLYFLLVDFFFRSFLPLIQSFLFFSWSWGNISLHYSLLLLPLSFLSMVYGILFSYVKYFLDNNFQGLQALVLVSHPNPLFSLPLVSSENTSHLLFSLTPLAKELGYTRENSGPLFSLWLRAAHADHLFSSFFSWAPWILFFPLLSWFLLSVSFAYFPPDISSPEDMVTFLLARLLLSPAKRQKHDLHWLDPIQGKMLEKIANYKDSHPVGGDMALRKDGKTELEYSTTQGKPPGSIDAGPIDTNGDPREVSLVPLPKKTLMENKHLTPMNAKVENNPHWDQARGKVEIERNAQVYNSKHSHSSTFSSNDLSSSTSSLSLCFSPQFLDHSFFVHSRIKILYFFISPLDCSYPPLISA